MVVFIVYLHLWRYIYSIDAPIYHIISIQRDLSYKIININTSTDAFYRYMMYLQNVSIVYIVDVSTVGCIYSINEYFDAMNPQIRCDLKMYRQYNIDIIYIQIYAHPIHHYNYCQVLTNHSNILIEIIKQNYKCFEESNLLIQCLCTDFPQQKNE